MSVKLLPIVDAKDVAGQITLQAPVHVGPNEAAQFRVRIVPNQKLSGGYIKTDQGSDPGPWMARLIEETTGHEVESASTRETGTAQRFCAISDSGVSGSYNGDPAIPYILQVWLQNGKKAGNLVLGWGDGGTR